MFSKAEIGEWEVLTMEKASKDLKIKIEDLKRVFLSKDDFLPYYNDCIDEFVLNSLTTEEIKSVDKDEVLKEYFMSKLENMNEFKLGFANILNQSINNPKFILTNLKSNKKSIQKYVTKLYEYNSLIKKSY